MSAIRNTIGCTLVICCLIPLYVCSLLVAAGERMMTPGMRTAFRRGLSRGASRA